CRSRPRARSRRAGCAPSSRRRSSRRPPGTACRGRRRPSRRPRASREPLLSSRARGPRRPGPRSERTVSWVPPGVEVSSRQARASRAVRFFERQAGGNSMDARLTDLKLALRMLTKDRGVTLVAVLTLALGIGANTALFSVVKAVLLNALPYAQADRLVSLGTGGPGDSHPTTVDFTTTFDYRARSRSFDHVVLYRGWSRSEVGESETELIRGQKVGHDFFDTLGVAMLLGRSFRPEEDAPGADRVLVLSHGLWLRRFGGDPRIVGRSVQLNGASYQVAGVLPPGFRPLRANADSPVPEMYAPLGYALGQGNACRGCQHLQAFARLKPGVSVAQAQAELE